MKNLNNNLNNSKLANSNYDNFSKSKSISSATTTYRNQSSENIQEIEDFNNQLKQYAVMINDGEQNSFPERLQLFGELTYIHFKIAQKFNIQKILPLSAI